MTLPEIKAALPKYIYLTPGVHKWREGDEYFGFVSLAWLPREKEFWGTVIKQEGPAWKIEPDRILLVPARRPIPDEVLENQAFWVLYNRLATVAPGRAGYGLEIWENPELLRIKGPQVQIYGTKGHFFEFPLFESKEMAEHVIPLLGGEQNIIKHLSAGDLYSKWIGEQIG